MNRSDIERIISILSEPNTLEPTRNQRLNDAIAKCAPCQNMATMIATSIADGRLAWEEWDRFVEWYSAARNAN